MIVEFEIGDSVIYDKGKPYEKRGIITEFTPLKQKVVILATDGKKYKVQMRELEVGDNCKKRYCVRREK